LSLHSGGADLQLRNPEHLASRLDLEKAERLLVVDAPEALRELVLRNRPVNRITLLTEGEAIRSVKETFDTILVWRESRVGSRSLLDSAVKRLAPEGAIWVVTAMKKVRGPVTPAIHRLEVADLEKGFFGRGLTRDRDLRITPWHEGHRFVRRETEDGRRKT